MKRIVAGLLGCLLVTACCVLPALARSNSSVWFDLRIELLRRLGAMPSFSACIVKGEDIVWQGSWGWSDVYRSLPATGGTQYLIGSVSKMVTAAAILQLAEEGNFTLDDDVSAFLPFALRNPSHPDEPITFRMLLSHHASLAAESAHFFPTFYFRPYDLAELESFLVPDRPDYVPTYWLDARPGERIEYANIGFEVLAYLVERISGQSFANYVSGAIFEPLGMTKSTFSAAAATEPAVPYMTFLGIPIALGHYEMGSLGAGGIRTTLSDLARFVMALMNEGNLEGTRILGPEMVAEMQTVQYPGHLTQGFEYGLGWAAYPGTQLGGHAGGAFGCRTMVRIRMLDKTAVIYSSNRLNPALPPAFTPLMNYADARLEAILWELADTL